MAWSDQKHVIVVGEDRLVSSYDCEVCSFIEELVKIAQARNPGQLDPGGSKYQSPRKIVSSIAKIILRTPHYYTCCTVGGSLLLPLGFSKFLALQLF